MHRREFQVEAMQPVELRLRFDAHAGPLEPSACSLSLVIRLLPGVNVLQTAMGCADTLNALIVSPSFVPQAVYFRREAFGQNPRLVLGFSLQPKLLPSSIGLPCLLVPSVDAVIPMSQQQFDLPVPQFLRPLSFHAQAAAISFGNLVVTDAYRVHAY